jgi:hypothetical protein
MDAKSKSKLSATSFSGKKIDHNVIGPNFRSRSKKMDTW